MLISHEVTGPIDADGVAWPSATGLYAVMALQSELNERMLEKIRELAGAAMIALPSSARDFENLEIARDLERYMQSATAPTRDKVAVMRPGRGVRRPRPVISA